MTCFSWYVFNCSHCVLPDMWGVLCAWSEYLLLHIWSVWLISQCHQSCWSTVLESGTNAHCNGVVALGYFRCMFSFSIWFNIDCFTYHCLNEFLITMISVPALYDLIYEWNKIYSAVYVLKSKQYQRDVGHSREMLRCHLSGLTAAFNRWENWKLNMHSSHEMQNCISNVYHGWYKT